MEHIQRIYENSFQRSVDMIENSLGYTFFLEDVLEYGDEDSIRSTVSKLANSYLQAERGKKDVDSIVKDMGMDEVETVEDLLNEVESTEADEIIENLPETPTRREAAAFRTVSERMHQLETISDEYELLGRKLIRIDREVKDVLGTTPDRIIAELERPYEAYHREPGEI